MSDEMNNLSEDLTTQPEEVKQGEQQEFIDEYKDVDI